ncbi:MAG: DeoR/GlpR transcriptional regulator [Carnobacterium sp.]|nr:DeoR/GlpR transcriptional regulator [Carnobacterium sp.]
MYTTNRHKKILALLNEKNSISVKELSDFLNFSPATIRSDLNYLNKQGLLIRTHGGATTSTTSNELIIEKNYSVRATKNQNLKREIAKIAIQHIKHGECIILDASSTCYELAKLLFNLDLKLTILTNGLKSAELLKDNSNITLILIGGIVKGSSNAIEGLLGTDILSKINIDSIFVSAHAFNLSDGLSDFNLYEVELKRKMVDAATNVFALVDSSKIEKTSIANFATAKQINILFTDNEISSGISDYYRDNNLTILTSSQNKSI